MDCSADPITAGSSSSSVLPWEFCRLKLTSALQLIAIEIGLALVREGLPRQHKRDTLTEADYRVA